MASPRSRKHSLTQDSRGFVGGSARSLKVRLLQNARLGQVPGAFGPFRPSGSERPGLRQRPLARLSWACAGDPGPCLDLSRPGGRHARALCPRALDVAPGSWGRGFHVGAAGLAGRPCARHEPDVAAGPRKAPGVATSIADAGGARLRGELMVLLPGPRQRKRGGLFRDRMASKRSQTRSAVDPVKQPSVH